MKKTTVRALAAGLAAGVALAGCASATSEKSEGPVELTFQTLAWQPALVEANKRIVEDWNAANPDVQVTLTQSDWDSVQDQLTTGFEGGTAPDVFHIESEVLAAFVERGNILDLSDHISEDYRAGLRESAWDSVTFSTINEGTWGIPFLQEMWALYVDENALAGAGIESPTAESPWTWDDYAEVVDELTVDGNGDGVPEVYGGGVPLRNPASRILPLAGSFGAEFFEVSSDGSVEGVFGDAEAALLTRLKAMLAAGTIAPELLTLSPSNSVAGFVGGQYATFVAPIYLRGSIAEGAPESFSWRMVAPLEGTSAAQASVTQTLAVNAATKHPAEAAAFLEFFLSDDNQVELARGDMLLPTSLKASEVLAGESDDWAMAVAAGDSLAVMPYQVIKGTEEWISKVASPAMEVFLAGNLSLDELSKTIVVDGNEILSRQNR